MNPDIDLSKLLPYSTAASEIGVSLNQLYKYERAGKFPKVKVGVHSFVRAEDVEALKLWRGSNGNGK